MNIAKGSESFNLFMNEDELEDFQRFLSIAVEDLVNVRPVKPKRYFALALCRALPAEDTIRYEFPEFAKELTFEESAKPGISEQTNLAMESKNTQLEYTV